MNREKIPASAPQAALGLRFFGTATPKDGVLKRATFISWGLIRQRDGGVDDQGDAASF